MSRSTQGNHLYKLFKLEALLLHAKFHGHRTLGSEEEDVLKILAIYGHGCHLDHVTKTIVTKFMLPPLSKVQHKFGFD